MNFEPANVCMSMLPHTRGNIDILGRRIWIKIPMIFNVNNVYWNCYSIAEVVHNKKQEKNCVQLW